MIFYILISIVFMAELIIAAAIIMHLKKIDKIFIETSSILNEAKPKIQQITLTIRKISEQLTELAPIWVEKTTSLIFNMFANHIKGIMTGIAIWAIRKSIHND